MKRRDPQSIEQIINDAIREGQLADNFDVQRASAMWPDIVGPDIAARTARRYVDGSELHVWISSAPLKNELQFHRSSLVDHLNRAVGRNVITEIHIH